MSDEELEVLVTIDDPPDAPEEDIFDHKHQENCHDEMLFALK